MTNYLLALTEINNFLVFVLLLFFASIAMGFIIFQVVKFSRRNKTKNDFELLIKLVDNYPEVYLEHRVNLDSEEFFEGITNAFVKLKMLNPELLNSLTHASIIPLSDNCIFMDGLIRAVNELSHEDNRGKFGVKPDEIIANDS